MATGGNKMFYQGEEVEVVRWGKNNTRIKMGELIKLVPSSELQEPLKLGEEPASETPSDSEKESEDFSDLDGSPEFEMEQSIVDVQEEVVQEEVVQEEVVQEEVTPLEVIEEQPLAHRGRRLHAHLQELPTKRAARDPKGPLPSHVKKDTSLK